jgi:four helix bundle protein
MQDFRKLRAWHAAKQLAIHVVDSIPEREARRVPGLRAQIVGAANSVHSNLAEGCGRAKRTDFLHFVDISIGSLNELDAQLESARDYGILREERYRKLWDQIVVVRKMLAALRHTLERYIAMEEEQKRRQRHRPPPRHNDADG